MKRGAALTALLAIVALFVGPAIATADSWYGSFVRDANYYLDVNCKIGCGIPPGSTISLVDKTSASPAPIAQVNDSVTGAALATYARNQVYNAGTAAYDRVRECGGSGSEVNGAMCVAPVAVDYTLASGVVATANQAWTQTMPAGGGTLGGGPSHIELCMSASAATTFTVSQSLDRGVSNWYAATIDNTNTSANFAPTGAGTICEHLGAANAIKVSTSAAVTVTIQAQANW